MGKYSKRPTPAQKRRRRMILIAACLALVIAIALLFFSCRKKDEGKTDTPFVPEIDQAAAQWEGMPTEPAESKAPSPGIQIPGYPTIRIPAGKAEVNLPLHNPEGNPCYFTFTLVLTENEEVLYESKQVPPGQGIATVTLNRPLPAGEHDAVIQIRTNSLEDGSPMNGANMVTVLVAE